MCVHKIKDQHNTTIKIIQCYNIVVLFNDVRYCSSVLENTQDIYDGANGCTHTYLCGTSKYL